MNYNGLEIAIIGMSGRFPGAENLNVFWLNLVRGKESISFLSKEEIEKLDVPNEIKNSSNYVPCIGGILNDKDNFDYKFFNFSKKEAELLHPQTRIFLECAWNALEDSGIIPDKYEGQIGVYACASSSTQWECITYLSGLSDDLGGFASNLLSSSNFLSTRTSYALNLKGPAVFLDSACSSSLVAVHLACRSLLMGDCKVALVGGTSIKTQKKFGYVYKEGMIMSSDGHCKAFDKDATGTIDGEGVGVVVLKTLNNAIKDKDNIYAIIKGSAINNDGNSKVGFTAPSIKGQVDVIRKAVHFSKINSEDINYVETHGTGTALGDPNEIEALTQAFNSEKKQFCPIGSVKTNIGHLDSAAGIAGLIKTVLILKNRKIPASLNYNKENEKINFKNTPFYLNNKLQDVESIIDYPMNAGVSSFGIGGTNAHIILQEFKELPKNQTKNKYYLIPLSARTKKVLKEIENNLKDYLAQNANTQLGDLAYTLQKGRADFEYRKYIVCKDINELTEKLGTDDNKIQKADTALGRPKNIFMFPGQGAQYYQMGIDLYNQSDIFKKYFNECVNIAKNTISKDYKDVLISQIISGNTENLNEIYETECAQPLIFIFEYSLAKCLIELGIQPHLMIGHSVGEYVAAVISGVFTLEQGIQVVIKRAKLMQSASRGSMLNVQTTSLEIESIIQSLELDIAALNTASSCVISGESSKIDKLEQQLESKGIFYKRLDTSHAFHSRMMESALDEFKSYLDEMELLDPTIPFISNLTGTWIDRQEAKSSDYWMKHLRSTVLFQKGIEELMQLDNCIFIEVGPGNVLSSIVKQYKVKKGKVINLIKHQQVKKSDFAYFLEAIGELWTLGLNANWNLLSDDEQCRKISLPTYPFEKNRFNIALKYDLKKTGKGNNIISDVGYYLPQWKKEYPQLSLVHEKKIYCLFAENNAVFESMQRKLISCGNKVILIEASESFVKKNSHTFSLNIAEECHYEELFNHLKKSDEVPHVVINLLNLNSGNNLTYDTDIGLNSFYTYFYMVKAIRKASILQNINIIGVTNGLHKITGNELVQPEKSLALGIMTVIPQEYSTIRCKNIDILIKKNEFDIDLYSELIITEIQNFSTNKIIAYRDGFRYMQDYRQTNIDDSPIKNSVLRKEGVYLIIGGLGKIGINIAKHLIKNYNARLVLTTRKPVPVKEDFNNFDQLDESQKRKINAIQDLDNLNGEYITVCSDVSNYDDTKKLIEIVEDKYGKINGVIHCAGEIQNNSHQVSLDELTKLDCEKQFNAKVKGLNVLYNIFKSKEYDFVWLYSSLSSVLGGLGFGAYAAANAYMDYFIDSIENAYKWKCIDWQNLTEQQTANAFEKILSSEMKRVVVSKGMDLNQKIQNWINLKHVDNKETTNRDVNVKGNVSNNETELIIANIWKDFLDLNNIGLDDNIFEIGANSLLIVQVNAKINKVLGVDLTVVAMYTYPTIKSLAKYLDEKKTDKGIDPLSIKIESNSQLSKTVGLFQRKSNE